MNDGPIPIRRDEDPEEPKVQTPEPDYGLAGKVFLWGVTVLTLALLGAGVVWVWQAVL